MLQCNSGKKPHCARPFSRQGSTCACKRAICAAFTQENNVRSTADQVTMLTQYTDVPSDTPKLRLVDEVLQAAEQHQDTYLLAVGNYARAFLMVMNGSVTAHQNLQAACSILILVKLSFAELFNLLVRPPAVGSIWLLQLQCALHYTCCMHAICTDGTIFCKPATAASVVLLCRHTAVCFALDSL